MAKSKKKPVVKKKSAAKKPAAKKASPKKSVKKKSTPAKSKAKKKAPSAKPLAPSMAKKIDLSTFVTPLDDRLMVQLAETEKRTAGGLYIPDTVADVSGNLQGLVVSVGRGRRNKKGQVRPMDLKVGDKVLFSEYSGSKIKIQNQELLILREGDVLGVIV